MGYLIIWGREVRHPIKDHDYCAHLFELHQTTVPLWLLEEYDRKVLTFASSRYGLPGAVWF